MGFTQVDVSLAYYSIAVASPAIQPNICPREDERARMHKDYGLPMMRGEAAVDAPVDEATYYKTMMDAVAKTILSGSGYADLAGDTIVFRQTAKLIADLEVGKDYRLSPAELEGLIRKVQVKQFSTFTFLGGGDVLVRNVSTANEKYTATMRLEAVSSAPGQATVVRLRSILIQPT